MSVTGRSDTETARTTGGASVVLLAVGGLATLAVAMGLGRFAFTPLLPDLMAGLKLSPADAGFIASANFLGYLIGAVLAGFGWAAGRERAFLVLALVSTTLLLAAVPFSDTVTGQSAIRFGAGIASAFAMVFSSTILFSHFDAVGRSNLQAVHFSGVGVGIAVSAVLVLVLYAYPGDWRAGWFVAALLSMMGSIVALAFIRVGPVRHGTAVREQPMVWTRKMFVMMIAYGLFGLGYIVTATFLVAIIRAANGHLSLEGLVWLATGFAAAPSVWVWAPVVGRVGLTAAFSIGCLVEAGGVAASVLVPVPIGPFVGGLLLGGTFVAVTAFGLQIGRRLAPRSPRRALAFMTASFGTGQIIGPIVAGELATISGSYTSGSLLAAAALVIASVLALTARPGPATQM